MNELVIITSRIITECSSDSIENLIYLIETGVISSHVSLHEVRMIESLKHITAPVLYDLLDLWKNSGVTSRELAFGLRTALHTKQKIQLKSPQVEMVWTGPYPPSGGLVRSTFSVMLEMLLSAERQVLLVGYSLTSSTTFPTAIIDQLICAKRRGCDVKIALHDDGRNYKSLRQAWPRQTIFPTLLKWVGNQDDEMASLHAKMLVIDRKEMLVTSANLTHHGLSSNIEVGVRIKGNVANDIGDHFLSLERSGILKRIEVNES